MNSVWRSLLWKEWREQRWVLGLMIAGCLLVPLGLLSVYRDWQSGAAGAAMMLCLGVPAMAMFIGAGIAARERSQRTLGFMQALPASMKKAAVAKLLVACATVTAPSILACLILAVTYFSYSPESTTDNFKYELPPLGFGALVCGAAAVSLLIWTAAAGVNHVDELRAGAIGLLAIACAWAVFVFLGHLYSTNANGEWPKWLRIAEGGAPGGIFSLMPLNTRYSPLEGLIYHLKIGLPDLVVALLVHAALSTWYVARLGRGAKPQAASEALETVPPVLQWLNSPRRTRARAIVWKQLRESAPLAALGDLAILVIAPIVAQATSNPRLPRDFVEAWQLMAISVWILAGVFVSVVGGIGLFYDDLRPGLHTFWRSRPIDIDVWFWIKLLTGLSVTVGVLAAGPVLTLAAHWATGHVGLEGLPQEPPLGQVIGLGLLLHATTFVLAALAITLVRQPVFAALATFFSGILAAMLVGSWFDDELSLGQGIWVLGAAAVVGLSTLAWQAVRNNWGWGRS